MEKIQLRKGGFERHRTLRTAGLFIPFVCMCGLCMCMCGGVCTHTCAHDNGGQNSMLSVFLDLPILSSESMSLTGPAARLLPGQL